MSTKKGCPERTWESPSNLNVLYKSFHVRGNMSRFWSFPLISFRPNLAVSLLTNGLTPHEVQQRGKENYLFIAPVALACWLSHSFLPRLVGPPRRPLAPAIHTFHALYTTVLSQHSSRQSAWWGCELLLASYLIPKLWFMLPPQKESKKKEKKEKANSWSFRGLASSCCPIRHMDSSICDGLAAVWTRQRTHRHTVSMEYEMKMIWQFQANLSL